MFYSISSGYPFFMVAFLQIVTFAGIYFKLGDLMAMFSLQSSDTQQVSRRIMRRPYMFLNRRARRLERKIGRTVAASAAGGVAGAAAASASTKKADNTKPAGSGHTRPNNTSADLPVEVTASRLLCLMAKHRSRLHYRIREVRGFRTGTVHSYIAVNHRKQVYFKRGIVDKKAVSKQPQSAKTEKQSIAISTEKHGMDKERQRQWISDKRELPHCMSDQ